MYYQSSSLTYLLLSGFTPLKNSTLEDCVDKDLLNLIDNTQTIITKAINISGDKNMNKDFIFVSLFSSLTKISIILE